MQDKLIVTKISNTPCDAADVNVVLNTAGVQFSQPLTPNWSDSYPYCPQVCFRMAYTDTELLINFKVYEHALRAVAAADNENIWEDTCVETFLSFGDDCYYNIECNCATRLLVGCGHDRNDRIRATQDILDTIKRWSSLGDKPFDVVDNGTPTEWMLSLIVPFKVFFKSEIISLDGTAARANFYKCGDKLPKPHFLSWQPVLTEKPNFHVPEFFGDVLFN